MEQQKLQDGVTYKLTKHDNTVILYIVKDDGDRYLCEVREGSNMLTDFIGERINVRKGSVLLKWDIERFSCDDFSDPYGKGVRINYKDPQLLELYLDMALQTRDKKWFNQIMKRKQEVSA